MVKKGQTERSATKRTERNTVNVRKPDVRFGKPDKKVSGFQTSGYRTSEDHSITPVFRHYKNPMCLKTGHSVRISDRLVPKPVPTGLEPVSALDSTKTGSKPVWNRFGTGFGT